MNEADTAEAAWLSLLSRIRMLRYNKDQLAKHMKEMTDSMKEDIEGIKRDYARCRDELRKKARGTQEVAHIKWLERMLADDFEKEFFGDQSTPD